MPFLIAAFGAIAYAIFLGTFLYAIGFVGNVLVPKTIDAGLLPGAADAPIVVALLVDTALLGLFAVQHSVMARPAFKRLWTRVVPQAMERSIFVLFASAALIALFAFWQPITDTMWDLAGTPFGIALAVMSALGWLLVLASTFMIDHFELFGLKQVWHRLTGRRAAPAEFRTPLVYKHVRHPIYLGFILAFWCTPTMSLGHLLFAVATSVYILLGIWFEERDLIAQFGQRYRDYRDEVGMLLPRLRRRDGAAAATARPRPGPGAI